MNNSEKKRADGHPETPFGMQQCRECASQAVVRKKVFLVFSHNSLARRWKKVSDALYPRGIELVVLGQHSDIDWEQMLQRELPKADVLYLDCSVRSHNFGRLIGVARSLPFALGGSLEVRGELSGRFDQQAERFQQYVANASPSELELAIHYLLQEQSKALGEWDGLRAEVPSPQPAQLCAIGDPRLNQTFEDVESYLAARKTVPGISTASLPTAIVPVLYGRRYWIGDDLQVISDLVNRIDREGFTALPVFCDFSLGHRLNDPSHPVAALLKKYRDDVVVLLNMAFSSVTGEGKPDAFFAGIGKPVLQLIRDYSHTEESWRESRQGGLQGMVYNFSVAQPEMLGVIEPHLIGVNTVEKSSLPNGETPLSRVVEERMERLVARIRRWHRLQVLSNAKKRIAIVLHSSPCKGLEATLGSAAGLNAAQSTVELMRRMQADGYVLENVPENGRALIGLILERKAHSEFRWTNTESIVAHGGDLARVNEAKYREWFDLLPVPMRQAIDAAWDPFPGKAMVHVDSDGIPALLITGIRFGNITVMVEAKRGCYGPKCDGEVCRILHQPDIPPTHHWLATAWYMQEQFDAIVQMGAESSLDYLPGKPVALSEYCYPDLSLGDLPRIYPYIMDSIGEGLLAKRRGRGVMIHHLTPPIRKVEQLAAGLDALMENHRQLLHAREHRHRQREAAIRDALREEFIERGFMEKDGDEAAFETQLEQLARRVQSYRNRVLAARKHVLGEVPGDEDFGLYLSEANDRGVWDEGDLRERLQSTGDELDHVLSALKGCFVPSGQGGAIGSGRSNLLPTGRNFYAMDLNAIPTSSAWRVGEEMGRHLLLKYWEDEGRFPESIGMTLWSSDAFMAEGELTSQCLWLLGCRPKWNSQGKVEGVEVTPLDSMTLQLPNGETLIRPRIDCVVRMSGVVRDLLEPVYLLLDDAVGAVAALDEPESGNFVRKHVRERMNELEGELQSLDAFELRRLASVRLFSDSAGSYGAGVGLAVDASAWRTRQDLADAYLNWTTGMCGRGLEAITKKAGKSTVAREFAHRIRGVDIAYQRAIASRYDALSISCYTGYQGGMAAARQAMSGNEAKLYWGDSQSGSNVEVRDLADEIDRALMSRLMTEDWVDSRIAEGYDGAKDLAGMVSTLFAWSATTGVVRKRHFDLVVRRIIENDHVRDSLVKENVYALEEITRRLLEAQSRGLWQADPETLDAVQQTMLTLEGEIEDRMGPVKGEFQGSSVDIKTSVDVDRWKWEVSVGEESIGSRSCQTEVNQN